jgi:stress-induced-phosphoprotein 1
MIDVLGVLMGIDMQGFTRPEGSGELPSEVRPSSPPQFPPASTSAPPKPKTEPVPAPAEEDVQMDDVDVEEVKAKKAAEQAKKAGNEAYKRRDFDEAIKQFEHAWDVWPQDITFLTNLGGE